MAEIQDLFNTDANNRLNGDSSSHRFGAASHATLVLEEVFV